MRPARRRASVGRACDFRLGEISRLRSLKCVEMGCYLRQGRSSFPVFWARSRATIRRTLSRPHAPFPWRVTGMGRPSPSVGSAEATPDLNEVGRPAIARVDFAINARKARGGRILRRETDRRASRGRVRAVTVHRFGRRLWTFGKEARVRDHGRNSMNNPCDKTRYAVMWEWLLDHRGRKSKKGRVLL